MRRAPKHLKEDGKSFWNKTQSEFEFNDEHEFRKLADAAMTRDTIASCFEKIEAEGLTYVDRWGQPRPHAAVKLMHDAQALFLRIIRELALDLSDDQLRPPRQYGK